MFTFFFVSFSFCSELNKFKSSTDWELTIDILKTQILHDDDYFGGIQETRMHRTLACTLCREKQSATIKEMSFGR